MLYSNIQTSMLAYYDTYVMAFHEKELKHINSHLLAAISTRFYIKPCELARKNLSSKYI